MAQKPVLSYRLLKEALIDRLLADNEIAIGRSEYVGGSEVGSCIRRLVYTKAARLMWRPDAAAAGVMQPGRLAENEGVQLLRGIGLDRTLSRTGANQDTLADGNLRSHPDGLLMADAFELDPSSIYYRADGTPWKFEELQPLIVGPGIMEQKSGSSTVFSTAIRTGVGPVYHDQCITNMGLSGRAWTMLMFLCRDNLSRMALFFIPADPARYLELQRRADQVMGTATVIRMALADAQVNSAEPLNPEEMVAIADPHLPPPEESRGYCQYCPIRDSCPVIIRRKDSTSFPDSVLAELEALVAMQLDSSEMEKSAKADKDDTNQRILAIREKVGGSKAQWPGLSLSIADQQGRFTANLDRLKTKYPEVYADCVSQGEGFSVIRVTRKKGNS